MKVKINKSNKKKVVEVKVSKCRCMTCDCN